MNDVVLVVEDDPSVMRAVVRNLAARDYDVRSAGTVAEAITALDGAEVRVLLLDIDLPDGSGWEVLRALRARGGDTVPVIVLSALRPNSRLIAEFGCFGVLEKPFPMEALLRQVKESIDHATGLPQSAVDRL